MSTPATFFLMTILALFALTLAWLVCLGVRWLWRKMFDDPDDHYSL